MTDNRNDTLRIAEIAWPGAPGSPCSGMIGVTFAPGKTQSGARSGSHARDLATDLDVIAAWNAAAVVTLVEPFELEALRIPTLGEEVRRRFMEWHHHPIVDGDVPDAAFEAGWPDLSARLRRLLDCGGRVLVHCKGGLGRAGSVAARLLVEAGVVPDLAIETVRSARPGAIETLPQERWVARPVAPVAETANADERRRDRAIGALLGLAVGDAVGAAIEFSSRPEVAVLSDMVGGGPFGLEPGQWTDDTAMALTLADSLLANPDLDPTDLMTRFVSWWREGTYSCTGDCFDIGIATRRALGAFERSGDPIAGSTRPEHSGNGALMRLSPVAIRHWPNPARLARVAALQTRTTHGSPDTIAASEIYAELIARAIAGAPAQQVLTTPAASRVQGGFLGLPREKVRGSGWVVHSLQAALWAAARTTTFRDAVLLAANLGEDADTTAAIAGQLAGALYGASGIPGAWLERLAWRARIEETAAALYADSLGGPATRIDDDEEESLAHAPVSPIVLTSNELEAANRAEATALLIRAGYRVYRPEADCYGEDLVVRAPDGALRPVQLKGRPTVDKKRYGGDGGIWMLFPDPNGDAGNGREWYFVPHETLYAWIEARHGHAAGWKVAWGYPHMSKALREFLAPYASARWAAG
ncbi:ADP-ribosylglycohydrolase family protein [Salinarimonas sp. NSM]|uniref:ADP-ribosylglycohydrolase family protein n=1 Tax=Salinarimonas sp. NSM TaxID=3458003 RepID=UPI00403694D7